MIILLSNKLSCVKNSCKSYTRSFSIISRYFTILLLFICVIYHFFFLQNVLSNTIFFKIKGLILPRGENFHSFHE